MRAADASVADGIGRIDMRKTLATLVLAVGLSTIPQLAFAATYADLVTGREIFATSTVGVFAGIASGSLPGTWTALVVHTPLSSPPSLITGGSFGLATTIGTVTGTFSGGAVTQTGGFAGCVNQTYTVAGTLTQVGIGGGSGDGTFTATLTHFNTNFFGRCITYKATVSGGVTLNF
jgi:hypothetical protein